MYMSSFNLWQIPYWTFYFAQNEEPIDDPANEEAAVGVIHKIPSLAPYTT